MLTRMLFVATLAVAFCGASVHAADTTTDTLPQVKQAIKKKQAVLVDVREKREWDQGHVEGAIFLPLSTLKAGITKEQLEAKIPRGAIVYTHCALGKRALTAGDILEKHGYEVRCLRPGFNDLLKAGFAPAKD